MGTHCKVIFQMQNTYRRDTLRNVFFKFSLLRNCHFFQFADISFGYLNNVNRTSHLRQLLLLFLQFLFYLSFKVKFISIQANDMKTKFILQKNAQILRDDNFITVLLQHRLLHSYFPDILTYLDN